MCIRDRKKIHSIDSKVKKIKAIPVELRRNSILRASGHTFEYLGYGPGNYSTGLPAVQDITLTPMETFLAQAQELSGGVVVYTGMNNDGDFFIGNKSVSSATGRETSYDTPIASVTGEEGTAVIGDFDEVTISQRLKVEGGASKTILSQFDGPVTFQNEIKINDDVLIDGDKFIIDAKTQLTGNLNVTGDITATGIITSNERINIQASNSRLSLGPNAASIGSPALHGGVLFHDSSISSATLGNVSGFGATTSGTAANYYLLQLAGGGGMYMQVGNNGAITFPSATSFTVPLIESTGDITANGNIVGDGATNIQAINHVTASGNISGSSISTGSFGNLRVAGLSLIHISEPTRPY